MISFNELLCVLLLVINIAISISARFLFSNSNIIINQPNYKKISTVIGIFFIVLSICTTTLSLITLGRSYSPLLEVPEDRKLIQSGIYKYVRHPMYLGLVLGLIGFQFIQPNAIGIATTVGMILTVLGCRIPQEEKELIKKFGQKYIDYKKHTIF